MVIRLIQTHAHGSNSKFRTVADKIQTNVSQKYKIYLHAHIKSIVACFCLRNYGSNSSRYLNWGRTVSLQHFDDFQQNRGN